MPHDKYNAKRGTSFHIQGKRDIFGARRYINKCTICGCEGYSPIILENDFLDQSSIKPYFPGGGPYGENRIIYEYLTKIFKKPLKLDNLGRCEDCASVMDKKHNYKRG